MNKVPSNTNSDLKLVEAGSSLSTKLYFYFEIYTLNVFKLLLKCPAFPFSDAVEANVVEDAIALWEEGTCLTFERLPLNSNYDSNHLLFTKIYTLG